MPGLGRLSVWAAGDVARCEMDGLANVNSGIQWVALTVKKRRDAHTWKRQECQLWDAASPYGWAGCVGVTLANAVLPANSGAAETGKSTTNYTWGTKQPDVRCLACVAKASGCDAACQASELTTRHTLWGCIDARKCAALEPKTANATAWKPWKVYVLDTVPSPDI